MTETSKGWRVAEPQQSFGGDWTEVKLSMLKDYLAAYTMALKRKSFSKMYIDAFAGSGYREIEAQEDAPGLFEEQVNAEDAGFFDGSVRLALQIDPPFDRYAFIEKSRKRINELRTLTEAFPSLSDRMEFCPGDANKVLPDLCRDTDWVQTRAVLFLDPFGMSVDWSTMEAVARTKAIDVWILFPVGIGVNRLLKKKPDDIPLPWQHRLDRIFGTAEWRAVFFRTISQFTLFGEESVTAKVGDAIRAIADYYQERLRTIFARVVSNPRYLCNSKQSPMFIFTFAVSNPSSKAQGLALRIAEHILGRKR
jgi:three-Cys-motif partner protein